MQFRRRWILGGLLAAMGCSSDPDVVALGTLGDTTSPGGFSDMDAGEGCRPGKYGGYFTGQFGTGGPYDVPIDGTLKFEIVETRDREFYEVTNAYLEGTTATDITFSADVVSENARGCRAGQITSRLSNGKIEGVGLTFEGSVTGTYDPARHEFKGDWTTQSPDGGAQTGVGIWNALPVQ